MTPFLLRSLNSAQNDVSRVFLLALTTTMLLLSLSLSTARGSSVGAQILTASSSFSPLNDDDFLKVDEASGQLRSKAGRGAAVRLRGTNLGGWLVRERWMTPLGVTDEATLRQVLTRRFGAATRDRLIDVFQRAWLQSADLDNIRALGLNFVRVPIHFAEITDDDGNLRGNESWTNLDWLVSECAARGIYVLLDLHGAYGGQNPHDHSGRVQKGVPELWTSARNQGLTTALWRKIAEHFRGHPAVAGYDLLNEPSRVPAKGLNDLYDRIYRTIREVDPDHVIFMEPLMEIQMDLDTLDGPGVRGWTNVVYEYHHYAMEGNDAGNWSRQNEMLGAALTSIREHRKMWPTVPFYMGEFNLFGFDDLWAKFFDELNSMNVHWTTWTLKTSPDSGNWALWLDARKQPPVPNPFTDLAEEIANKWSQYETRKHFKPNSAFQQLIQRHLN